MKNILQQTFILCLSVALTACNRSSSSDASAVRAFKNVKLAAELGDSEAQEKLAQTYYHGTSVQKSHDEAIMTRLSNGGERPPRRRIMKRCIGWVFVTLAAKPWKRITDKR
jgi:hypothetical protein